MKKLFTITLLLMMAVAYSWGYTTVTVTYTGTANDAFKNALEAIDATTEYSAAKATDGRGNGDEKLKLVITPAAGAPNFDATAVSVLNTYLSGRLPQYREIDLSACTTLTALPAGAFSGRDLVRIWSMPSTITTIGNNAFDGCKEATSITFGTGSSAITSIGSGAFQNCESLTSVDVSGATSVGSNAFNGTGITSLTLGINPVGQALGGLNNTLQTLTLTNAQTVTAGLFQNFTALTTINLPAVTEVENNAFNGCTSLSSVSLPECTTIRWDIFNGCTSLTSISLPKVTTMNDNAFRGSSLTTITMNAITALPDNAFANATALTTLNIPSVTSLGAYVFNHCTSLISVDLSNVEQIAANAFNGSALTTISLPKITEVQSNDFRGLSISGDIILPNVIDVQENAFYDCSATSLTVGTAGKSLHLYDGAFRNTEIPTITLHDTSVIPAYCFAGSEVTKLVMQPVTSIDRFAFQDNSTMEALPFTATGCNGWSTSCTEIPEGCFAGCISLLTIDIPSHITTINRSFVDLCINLTEINVDSNNNNYSSVDHLLCNKAGDTVIVFPEGKAEDQTYTFPDQITTLANNSCYQTYFKNVTFGSGMTTVGELVFNESAVETITINTALADVNHGAFANTKKFRWFNGAVNGTTYYTNGTDGLLYKKEGILYRCPEQYADANGHAITSLDLRSNETITHVEDAAFSKCKNLTSVQLPNTVQTLGGHAFEYCKALETFTLPSDLNPTPNKGGVAGFGDAPFRGCSNLKSIDANGANDKYHTVENGMLCDDEEKELLICPAAYANGVADPTQWDGKVQLPHTLQIITAAAFDGCQYIREVVIPQGVYSIETGAFQNSSVETVVIPHSMTSAHTNIDWFQGCNKLKNIYILAEEVLGQVDGNKKRFNEFYNVQDATFQGLTIYVSNEYSEGGNNLVTGYQAAKHDKGTGDMGWGDAYDKGATITDMYHRAITEDYAPIAAGEYWDASNQFLTTNPTYKNQTSANKYSFITLYRKFDSANENTLYTLSLPVAMTAEEVTATFGEGTQIYHFTGRTDRVLNFTSATTIPAGTAVLIKPARKATSYMIDLRNSTPTAEAIGESTVVGTGADQQTTGNTTVNAQDETVTGVTFNYAFNPTWQKDAVMPQYGYYVGEEGNVYRVTQPGRKIRKALRGYITGGSNDVTEPSNMSVLGIDLDGVVTGIEDVRIEGMTTNQTGNVYNAQGQLVRKGASTEGLPRGLYVVNGKKIFVD